MEFKEFPVKDKVPSIVKSPATKVLPKKVLPNDLSVPEMVASMAFKDSPTSREEKKEAEDEAY